MNLVLVSLLIRCGKTSYKLNSVSSETKANPCEDKIASLFTNTLAEQEEITLQAYEKHLGDFLNQADQLTLGLIESGILSKKGILSFINDSIQKLDEELNNLENNKANIEYASHKRNICRVYNDKLKCLASNLNILLTNTVQLFSKELTKLTKELDRIQKYSKHINMTNPNKVFLDTINKMESIFYKHILPRLERVEKIVPYIQEALSIEVDGACKEFITNFKFHLEELSTYTGPFHHSPTFYYKDEQAIGDYSTPTEVEAVEIEDKKIVCSNECESNWENLMSGLFNLLKKKRLDNCYTVKDVILVLLKNLKKTKLYKGRLVIKYKQSSFLGTNCWSIGYVGESSFTSTVEW